MVSPARSTTVTANPATSMPVLYENCAPADKEYSPVERGGGEGGSGRPGHKGRIMDSLQR